MGESRCLVHIQFSFRASGRECVSFDRTSNYFSSLFLQRTPIRTILCTWAPFRWAEIRPGCGTDWRDVKSYKNHAIVVSEIPDNVMQVFDLTMLLTANQKTRFKEMSCYSKFRSAHNVFVNEDTGYMYAMGATTCIAWLHFVYLGDPATPKNRGCYSQDKYIQNMYYL